MGHFIIVKETKMLAKALVVIVVPSDDSMVHAIVPNKSFSPWWIVSSHVQGALHDQLVFVRQKLATYVGREVVVLKPIEILVSPHNLLWESAKLPLVQRAS